MAGTFLPALALTFMSVVLTTPGSVELGRARRCSCSPRWSQRSPLSRRSPCGRGSSCGARRSGSETLTMPEGGAAWTIFTTT